MPLQLTRISGAMVFVVQSRGDKKNPSDLYRPHLDGLQGAVRAKCTKTYIIHNIFIYIRSKYRDM